jgi:hypothetical protein
MNNNIYHETKQSTYIDNGDGSLTVHRKDSKKLHSTVGYFKNDEQGRRKMREFRRKFNFKTYTLFRCPTSGRTYDQTNGTPKCSSGIYISRKGNIRKSEGKVIAVLMKDKMFGRPLNWVPQQ